MAFKKGAPGRPKGAKGLKTIAKENAINGALVLASTSLVETKKKVRKVTRPADIEVAPPGITPKDLFLTAMRSAWDDHKYKMAEARVVEDEAERLTVEAVTMERNEGEPINAHKARIALALEPIKVLRERVAHIRDASRASLNLALDCGNRAAPYEHAKLTDKNNSGDVNVTVVLRQF